MIYEIVWDTEETCPRKLDLPKYVVVSNHPLKNPKTKESYPDPPVFHIIPSDYPDFDASSELSELLTEVFDWCVSSIYIVNNDTFNKDMEFFAENGYVQHEFKWKF